MAFLFAQKYFFLYTLDTSTHERVQNATNLSNTLPQPPPPGEATIKRSPGIALKCTLPGSACSWPSCTSVFLPHCPGSPPCKPYGGLTRRSLSSVTSVGTSKLISRIRPSPPRAAPRPPEPSRNW